MLRAGDIIPEEAQFLRAEINASGLPEHDVVGDIIADIIMRDRGHNRDCDDDRDNDNEELAMDDDESTPPPRWIN